ncbi:MAG: plasmid recombination protein [Ruminococcus sp.]|nr:plasmid recombination protein [Ruminococcus sp.]
MNAQGDNGLLAKKMLDEYYQGFQARNPNLYVFSAHLHMDEATPHLHIDFVPFTTGSKRGLDTRVSLKQALAKQGFVGGSKHDTEWNQWIQSEKEELSKVMQKYDIEWEQKGTHEKHLSVYDYEKKMRAEEVKTLEKESEKLQIKVDELNSKISDFKEYEDEIEEISNVFYEEEEYQLPDPPPLMTAKNYKIRFVEPLIQKLIKLAKTAVKRCFEFKTQLDSERLWYGIEKAKSQQLSRENDTLSERNQMLEKQVGEYKLLRKVFGNAQIDKLLEQAKSIITQSKQHDKRFRNNQNER